LKHKNAIWRNSFQLARNARNGGFAIVMRHAARQAGALRKEENNLVV